MRPAFLLALAITLQIGSAQDTLFAKISGVSDSVQELNGKIGKLDITVKLDVKGEGTYRVTFELSSANGNSITGRARGRLAAGSQSLRTSFDVAQIDNYLAQDGPYRISDMRLFLENENSEPTYADSLENGGQTAAYRLADLYRNLYSFTGEVKAEGMNRMPNGKFATLRVTVGVDTPGGLCSWQGFVTDLRGNEISSEFNLRGQLPAGKGELNVDFEGFRIAHTGVNGPIYLNWITLTCPGGAAMDTSRHRTADFNAADFDNSWGEFEFVPASASVKIAAGNTGHINIDLRCKCDFQEEQKIAVVIEADDPRLQFPTLPGRTKCSSSPACTEGPWASLNVKTDATLAPGTYPIRLTARGLGKVRTATANLVIDPDLTRSKQQHDAELIRLKTEDDVPPATPAAPPRSSPDLRSTPQVTYKAGVALRKIHAVLVLDRSNSMNQDDSCEFMKAAATRFTRLFAGERDSVAVLSYGNTVQRTLPMTNQFLTEGPERISKITCHDTTNTGLALEIAREELAQHEDPEAIDAVILFTDGQSNVLTANWPVKARGCTGAVGACTETICKEAQAGQVPAILVPVGDRAVFEPADTAEKDELRWYSQRVQNSCFGSDALPNYAYIPEQDLHGIALTGSRSLERIAQGPNAGRIRLDSPSNWGNAASNQIENAARQLRLSQPNPAFFYIIGFSRGASSPINYLRELANDPQAATYNPNESAGLAVVTSAPEGFDPSFQRVCDNLVEHATVR